jgi:hypothetical protein
MIVSIDSEGVLNLPVLMYTFTSKLSILFHKIARLYRPELIKHLRSNVEVWDQQWTTLTVFREDGKSGTRKPSGNRIFSRQTLLQVVFLV